MGTFLRESELLQLLANGTHSLSFLFCLRVHADLLMGDSILVSNQFPPPRQDVSLTIIDWETCQYDHTAQDLGSIICDLITIKHLRSLDAATDILRSLVDMYGIFDTELAFHTAIQTGIRILSSWDYVVPGAHAKEKTEGLIMLACDLIVKGVQRDREWFEHTVLACLFSNIP